MESNSKRQRISYSVKSNRQIKYQGVLIQHNAPRLHWFRLKCAQNYESSHVNAWIYQALRRHVQKLHLCVPTVHGDLFRTESLVYLKLGTNFVLNVPTSVLLPSLKTLHLNSIEFSDDASTYKLISSCPVLEQLFTEECGMKNIRCFNISAHALKCLAMECAILDHEYATEFCGYKIVIDAPKLEYLRLYDYVAEGYHFKNLKSLIEAQVHVDLSTRKIEQRDRAYYGQKVLELIKGIHNVKVLHLTGDSMEALMLSGSNLPTLHNVSHLEVNANKLVGCIFLPDLLKSVPNIRALDIGEFLSKFLSNRIRNVPNVALALREFLLNRIKSVINIRALDFGEGLGSKWGVAEYKGSISTISHNIFKKAIVQEAEDRVYHREKEEKDGINRLPCKVLCHILSFLPTKYAVGTSILSTTWKNLWSSVPNLNFDDELLLHGRRPGSKSTEDLRVSFSSFVDRVLKLHNAPHIHRFHLKCGQDYEPSQVNAWICSAVRGKVQELDLCFPMRNSKYSLYCGLFTSASLVNLKLGTKFVLNVPASVLLPSLKTLHLNSIEFSDDDSTHKLFSSCPVLEELSIVKCGMKRIRCFKISGPILNRLTIECAIEDEYSTKFCEYKIIIDTPALEYFRLYDFVAEGYDLKNLKSLTEAQLHVELSTPKLEQKGYAYYGQRQLELMKGICNVKKLHLTGDYMEVLKLSDCNLPTLHNVSHLKLSVNKHSGWQFLPDLLKSLPNLLALYFPMGLVHERGGDYRWDQPEWVPRCLLSCLKKILIWQFQGQKGEYKLVKYLLQNASVLSVFCIKSHNNLTIEEELKISKMLLFLPRGSKTCQFVFS
ncbi:f-box/lrr-repeat protein [Quercus suber]|uniref:F-box/lrr-repeat protein n=2 Tax=Quercus suber TaxID=58331 RepID=A0AAW0IVV5_QUESU